MTNQLPVKRMHTTLPLLMSKSMNLGGLKIFESERVIENKKEEVGKTNQISEVSVVIRSLSGALECRRVDRMKIPSTK